MKYSNVNHAITKALYANVAEQAHVLIKSIEWSGSPATWSVLSRNILTSEEQITDKAIEASELIYSLVEPILTKGLEVSITLAKYNSEGAIYVGANPKPVITFTIDDLGGLAVTHLKSLDEFGLRESEQVLTPYEMGDLLERSKKFLTALTIVEENGCVLLSNLDKISIDLSQEMLDIYTLGWQKHISLHPKPENLAVAMYDDIKLLEVSEVAK